MATAKEMKFRDGNFEYNEALDEGFTYDVVARSYAPFFRL